MENYFITLNNTDCSKKIEKKNGMTYLSWAWAWGEIKKIHPNATYIIKKFGENNLPFVYDEKTGYMVFTEMTIENITHEMWLPVMDGANKAMKNKPYTYQVNEYVNGAKTGNMIDKSVDAFTMFDINKTIMRCLTKCLAMFGLGLYIYNNEDMPEVEPEQPKPITSDMLQQLEELIKKIKKDGIREKFCIAFEIKDLKDMPMNKFASAIKRLNLTIEEEKKANEQ